LFSEQEENLGLNRPARGPTKLGGNGKKGPCGGASELHGRYCNHTSSEGNTKQGSEGSPKKKKKTEQVVWEGA